MNDLQHEKLLLLIELSNVLSQMDNYDAILTTITRKAIDFLMATDAHLELVNPSTQQTIKTIVRNGTEDDPLQRKARMLVNGWVFKHNQVCLIHNAQKHELFKKTSLAGKVTGSVLALPIRSESRLVGALILRRGHRFEPADVEFAENFATIISPYFRDTSNLQKYFAASIPEDTLRAKYEKLGLIGKSKTFIDLLKSIDAAANTDVRVLLEGESGTGKERVARAIHRLSSRNDRAFIAIDCGAIPANLIESELFGHVRGAFTGANTDRKGLLEEAHNGTLFLDEIASMPHEVQSKLLRVLQEGEIKPVGSNKSRKVDVRIIAASSSSLQKLVQQELFREDLYYRLYVYPITVPSLHERKLDIPRLANHFLKRFAQEQGKTIHRFDPQLLEYMSAQPWQGNIRELENFVERLTTLTPKEASTITVSVLPQDLKKQFKKAVPQFDINAQKLNERLAEVEEEMIRQALIENDWNQSQAARALGISEYTMRYKMSKLGIRKLNQKE